VAKDDSSSAGPQVVALCSQHHTEISLVADYASSLSFWCVHMPALTLPAHHEPCFDKSEA
jgi:hypothetical protein